MAAFLPVVILGSSEGVVSIWLWCPHTLGFFFSRRILNWIFCPISVLCVMMANKLSILCSWEGTLALSPWGPTMTLSLRIMIPGNETQRFSKPLEDREPVNVKLGFGFWSQVWFQPWALFFFFKLNEFFPIYSCTTITTTQLYNISIPNPQPIPPPNAELFTLGLHCFLFCQTPCSDLELEMDLHMSDLSVVLGSHYYWANDFCLPIHGAAFDHSVLSGIAPSHLHVAPRLHSVLTLLSLTHVSRFLVVTLAFAIPSFLISPYLGRKGVFSFCSYLFYIPTHPYYPFLCWMYFLLSQCGIFPARSLWMGRFTHLYTQWFHIEFVPWA